MKSEEGKYQIDTKYALTARDFGEFKVTPFVTLGNPKVKSQYILVGDSHAQFASTALKQLSIDYGIPGDASCWSSTFPTSSLQLDTQNAQIYGFAVSKIWRNYIVNSSIKNILFVCRWNTPYTNDFILAGHKVPLDRDSAHRIFISDICAVIENLIRHGKEIWILDQVPMFKYDPTVACRVIKSDYSESYYPVPSKKIAVEIFNQVNNSHVHLLSAESLLVRDHRLYPLDGSHLLYCDTHHLTTNGSLHIKNAFKPMFEYIKEHPSY